MRLGYFMYPQMVSLLLASLHNSTGSLVNTELASQTTLQSLTGRTIEQGSDRPDVFKLAFGQLVSDNGER